MCLLTRVSILAVALLSATYSAYALLRYRAAWRLCRQRLVIPRAVRLFHVRLAKKDLKDVGPLSHSPSAKVVSGTSLDVNAIVTTERATATASDAPAASSSSLSPSVGRVGMGAIPLPCISCPVAFVDTEAFDANVRAVGIFLLNHDKQVRLSTKSVRCPELLERAATLLEKLAHPCTDYDIISPGKPFVSGLLTSTAMETLHWARRATFSSLLLENPLADAASAARYVEAMTLNNPSKVHCQIVVDAVEQLEFLWAAAKEWITDSGYARLGFDSALESLQFNLLIHIDVSLQPFWRRLYHCSKRPHAIRSSLDAQFFLSAVEEFNVKVAREKLPVGVRFVVHGFWADEGGQLSHVDTAPVAVPAPTLLVPVRWFMLYPALQWYKQRVAKSVNKRRRTILRWFGDKKRVPRDNVIISGGSSASFVHSALDDTLSEVCVGAGLLCGHQLDRYVDSLFRPALYFALSITRAVSQRVFVCSGFGQNLPGAAAVFPPQLRCTSDPAPHIDDELETGVVLRRGVLEPVQVAAVEKFAGVGEPVVFRPSRSGTLAELVDVYLLVTKEGEVEAVMRTYRGEGWNMWA